jgi:hypothetical protein
MGRIRVTLLERNQSLFKTYLHLSKDLKLSVNRQDNTERNSTHKAKVSEVIKATMPVEAVAEVVVEVLPNVITL